MGEFIKIEINPELCGREDECGKWVGVCPVNIFKMENGRPVVVEENEDECTLCQMCREQAPDPEVVKIIKLYE